MADKRKIKSIQFVIEGNITESRDCAENILMNMFYELISDWNERSKYIDRSLQSANYDREQTKLYYAFLKEIEEPKKPESDQEA